ncbi:MAG: hypothetical protein OZ921_09130 [Sorangiineae bacterium]|nr:hypothetical protein [Polyangiaceae bacterium]MEB2322665.1 hypothetical protein [Sorangiineae bacterium]
MRRLLCALAFCAGLTLAASPAAAETPKTIQVLTVMSDDAFPQAQALTIALKRVAARSEGWSVGQGEYSLEVMVAALNCPAPPDAACQERIGAKIGAKRFIWGSARLEGKNVVVNLHLWEGTEKRHTTLHYSANLTDATDDALLKIAESGFAALAGAAQGALVVRAGTQSGQVLLDGNPIGNLTDGRGEFLVPVGTHEVRVRVAGHNDAVGTVDVSASGRAELTLTPSPKSASGADGSDDGVSVNTGKMSTRRILAYTGLGLGGALIAGGVYSWVKIDSVNSDERFDSYRRAVRTGLDVCEEAEANHTYAGATSPSEIADLCSSARTWQTLQYVFFGTGIALAGAGTYLLLTDRPAHDQARAAPPRLVPTVGFGPHGGQVDVRVAF